MNKWQVIAIGLLLLASCGEKEPVAEPVTPAIRAELIEATAFDASFSVQAINTGKLRYGIDERMSETLETGSEGPVTCTVRLSGLQPLTSYELFIVGIGPSGEEGTVLKVPFQPPKGLTVCTHGSLKGV